MTEFKCPQCDNHVEVAILCNDEYRVEAWCCTAHPKPVRMELTDDNSPPE